MNGVERRVKKRLPMRGFLSCDCSFTKEQQRQMAFELISLSSSGMFLVQKTVFDFEVSEGDILTELSLTLAPFEKDSFNGIVRRIIRPEPGLGQRCGFGLEFQNLHSDLEGKIDAFINVQVKFFGLE